MPASNRGRRLDGLKDKLLAQIRPDSLADETAGRQQRKSSEMRVRILEATIDCLVEKGYSGLATNEIAARAGISRGAMHHHYANRMTLVAAVIEYAAYRRMAIFLSDYLEMPPRSDDVSAPEAGTAIHWTNVQSREYAAYLELAVAARTDPELHSHFGPVARKFDKVWRDEMFKSFPQWTENWEALQAANDFVMAAHMGLLIHAPIFDSEQRLTTVRDLIARVVQQLHLGKIQMP